jgi:hypothetical protein
MAVKLKQHKGKWWVFIDHKGKRKAKCVGSKQAAETAAKKIEAQLILVLCQCEYDEPLALLSFPRKRESRHLHRRLVLKIPGCPPARA